MIVKTFLMDMEFDKAIYDLMENVVVNTSAAKEHVPEIEITIYTFKDRTLCIVTTMPFKYLQKLLISNMVYFSVLWLNALPVKNGILDKISPRVIMARTKK